MGAMQQRLNKHRRSDGLYQIKDFCWNVNDVLGCGSFGVVFRGINVKTNIQVAIKCTDCLAFTDKKLLEALENEINLMKSLDSTHTVQLYDYVNIENIAYTIMELCQGDLDGYLRSQGGRLPEQQAIQVLQQILLGLKELTEHSFIHRDIKPANVLIKNGLFKIADFGFSTKIVIESGNSTAALQQTTIDTKKNKNDAAYQGQALMKTQIPAKQNAKPNQQDLTVNLGKTPAPRIFAKQQLLAEVQPHKKTEQSEPVVMLCEVCGSPMYESPQILLGEWYTAKSDIWSVGMMFYQMLFNVDVTPWPCRDVQSYIDCLRKIPLRFPYSIPISRETQDFLTQCLAYDEKNRLGWDQIFTHPMLQRQIGLQLMTPERFDLYTIKIFGSIQESIQTFDINYSAPFLKFSEHPWVTLDQFKATMTEIDPSITRKEIEHIFKAMEKNDQINISSIQQLLVLYDFRDCFDQQSRILGDIREILRSTGIDLKQLFQQTDEDVSGWLSPQEFSKLLFKFLPNMSPHNVELLFRKFDTNGDGKIQFNEFYENVTKGIRKLGNISQHLENQLKSEKLWRQIETGMSNQGLQPSERQKILFQGKTQLSYDEFSIAVRKFDESLQPDEIKLLFTHFTSGAVGNLTYNDLEHKLKQLTLSSASGSATKIKPQ